MAAFWRRLVGRQEVDERLRFFTPTDRIQVKVAAADVENRVEKACSMHMQDRMTHDRFELAREQFCARILVRSGSATELHGRFCLDNGSVFVSQRELRSDVIPEIGGDPAAVDGMNFSHFSRRVLPGRQGG